MVQGFKVPVTSERQKFEQGHVRHAAQLEAAVASKFASKRRADGNEVLIGWSGVWS